MAAAWKWQAIDLGFVRFSSEAVGAMSYSGSDHRSSDGSSRETVWTYNIYGLLAYQIQDSSCFNRHPRETASTLRPLGSDTVYVDTATVNGDSAAARASSDAFHAQACDCLDWLY